MLGSLIFPAFCTTARLRKLKSDHRPISSINRLCDPLGREGEFPALTEEYFPEKSFNWPQLLVNTYLRGQIAHKVDSLIWTKTEWPENTLWFQPTQILLYVEIISWVTYTYNFAYLFIRIKYTGGWSNWDRSNWDKIDLIGRWTYAIDIQAALTAEPPPIYLEKSERNCSRAFVYRFPSREILIAQDLIPFVD